MAELLPWETSVFSIGDEVDRALQADAIGAASEQLLNALWPEAERHKMPNLSTDPRQRLVFAALCYATSTNPGTAHLDSLDAASKRERLRIGTSRRATTEKRMRRWIDTKLSRAADRIKPLYDCPHHGGMCQCLE